MRITQESAVFLGTNSQSSGVFGANLLDPAADDLERASMSEDPQNDRLEPPPSPTEELELAAPTTDPTVEPPAAPTAESMASPAPSASPPRRPGILMPTWVVLVLAGVLLFGLGMVSGHFLGSDEGHRREFDRGNFRGRMWSEGGPANRVGPMHPGGASGNGGRSGNGPGVAGPANGFLGVAVRNSSSPKGAELAQVVASSPAADAGLKTGDVITAIDGAAVNDAAELTSRVRAHGVGDELTIAYTRSGADRTTKATLASRAQLRQQ